MKPRDVKAEKTRGGLASTANTGRRRPLIHSLDGFLNGGYPGMPDDPAKSCSVEYLVCEYPLTY